CFTTSGVSLLRSQKYGASNRRPCQPSTCSLRGANGGVKTAAPVSETGDEALGTMKGTGFSAAGDFDFSWPAAANARSRGKARTRTKTKAASASGQAVAGDEGRAAGVVCM